MTSKLWFIVITLSIIACKEENPYKGQYRVQTAETAASGNQNVGAGNSQNAADNTAEEAATAADEDAIAADDLNAVQLVCQDTATAAKFPIETAVLCLNGQPTNAFASALASPYKGGDNATLGVVKSEDVNGVSHFVLISTIEIPLPLATVFEMRADLNPVSFVEGNATINQIELSATPAQGGNQLGSYDLQFDLRVRVAIITVEERRILQRDFFALAPDQMVIASATYLKPGAAGNNPNSVSNLISYWIADGNNTKLITVTHQQADNRGQHATAETTVTAIGSRTMRDTYALFVQ